MVEEIWMVMLVHGYACRSPSIFQLIFLFRMEAMILPFLGSFTRLALKEHKGSEKGLPSQKVLVNVEMRMVCLPDAKQSLMLTLIIDSNTSNIN
jgi:hypothetical protein